MSNTNNNNFYICNTCNMKSCPFCNSIHDKEHEIINYAIKNVVCKKHNESFIKYCKKCNENLCILCDNEPKNHEKIYLGDI